MKAAKKKHFGTTINLVIQFIGIKTYDTITNQ